MAEINDWDVTAGGNGFAAPDGFPEGMNYSQVNNAARELMAVTRRFNKDSEGELASTGAGGAYVISPARTLSAYADGQSFRFRANHTNSGASTINVDSVGTVPIVTPKNAALVAGALTASGVYDVAYSSALASFVLLGSFSTLAGEIIGAATDTSRGAVELATNAETITGTDTARVAPLSALTALFNNAGRRVTSATSGYQKLPGGLIVQWGRSANLGDIVGGNLTGSQNYATSFPTATLIATAFPVSVGAPNNLGVFVFWDQAATTASTIFYDYTEVGGAVQANFAIGYIAIGY